jgi:ABC-type bacteriocin/lantibiotic exporter with double-glycine peptidase domain
VNQATLSYEALEAPVLKALNHSFSHGKVHAIVGPSGSGKSTLISALLGLHKPEQGTVDVQLSGQNPNSLGGDLDLHDWILHVGYLSQQPFLFQGTVRDNLTLRVPGATLNEERIGSLIQKLHLDDCLGAQPLEFGLHEAGNNLSGGQQQRLALLRALQIKRPVLILDEATSALDNELRDVVFDLLQERAAAGCNVILVTHDNELAQRCDDVLDLGTLSNDLVS